MHDYSNIAYTFSNGITVVNTTPHPITFQSPEGEIVKVPTSVMEGERTGYAVINAQSVEKEIAPHIVDTQFVPSDQARVIINEIKSQFADQDKEGNLIIVGSMIAANTYPEVKGMTPVPGYERVPPDQKRMSCEKFTQGSAKDFPEREVIYQVNVPYIYQDDNRDAEYVDDAEGYYRTEKEAQRAVELFKHIDTSRSGVVRDHNEEPYITPITINSGRDLTVEKMVENVIQKSNLQVSPQTQLALNLIAQEAVNKQGYVDLYNVLQYHNAEELKNLADVLQSHDKQAAIELLSTRGDLLQDLPTEFQNDKEVVMAAVKDNGFALDYASDTLKNDKEVVMEAVKNEGFALGSASASLRDDKDVVLAAIRKAPDALEYASDRLRGDKTVVLEAIAHSTPAFWYVSPQLCNDARFLAEAIRVNPDIIDNVPDNIRSDVEELLEPNTEELAEEPDETCVGAIDNIVGDGTDERDSQVIEHDMEPAPRTTGLTK